MPLPEWKDGELVVRVPEPDDPDWSGAWEVVLLRAGTDIRVPLEGFECREMAVAKALRIARVLYPDNFTEGTIPE